MKVITSKFRNLYIVKLLCGYIIAVLGIYICTRFFNEIYDPIKGKIATVFIILIILFIIAGSVDFLRITKVILKKEELEIQSFFGARKRIIKFTEIVSIERHKIIQQGKAGQISDGYYVSDIFLSDKSSFRLSPDKFENYNELMIFIRNNYA